jgi:hypothetical protein
MTVNEARFLTTLSLGGLSGAALPYFASWGAPTSASLAHQHAYWQEGLVKRLGAGRDENRELLRRERRITLADLPGSATRSFRIRVRSGLSSSLKKLHPERDTSPGFSHWWTFGRTGRFRAEMKTLLAERKVPVAVVATKSTS